MEISSYNEIVQHWIEQVMIHRGTDAEASLRYCQDIIDYGLEHEDNTLIGFGYFFSGETYYLLNDGTRFFEEISSALEYLDRAQEWELVGKCYNFLGIWAMNRGNMPVALDYYLNGIGYCRKNGFHHMEALMNINVGAMNNQMHRYEEAEMYLRRALEYMKPRVKESGYHIYMNSIYMNLAKSLIFQERYMETEEILGVIYGEHWQYIDEVDKLLDWCIEAVYLHKIHEIAKRDLRIQDICNAFHNEMPVLDIFADLQDFMELLLEAGKDEAFWNILEVLEQMCGNCNIIHMQLEIISLKISFYRTHSQSAEYLQAAGLYYELSQLMNRETQDMINNILNLRKSLETANRMREEMEVENRILMEKSELDPLTKLANRFRLNDYSEQLYAGLLQEGGTIAVEMLDVDYFKEFNDNYGHQAGDGCLKAVADAIRETAENHGGFCARYGGDEFVVIYQNPTKQEALQFAAELKAAVLGKNVVHAYSKAIPLVSVSQGLCWGKVLPDLQCGDFLHRADEMLYKVKQVTRNNYCVGEISDEAEPLVGPVD